MTQFFYLDGTIIMGKKQLMLTIVKPLINENGADMSLVNVLQDRFIHELKHLEPFENVAKLAKMYRKNRQHLPKCRLKATLFHCMGYPLSQGISTDIFDSGNKVSGLLNRPRNESKRA